MKFLRLVQSGYENYTGPIGPYEFEDGVSVHQIPRVDRDRLATAFEFVEYEAEGDEHVPAGVAYRLIALSGVRAQVNEPLQRQTEEEKAVEQTVVESSKDQDHTIYTRAELERIADKRGIGGLREIGDKWDVKSREIMKLIGMIIQAQDTWLAIRDAKTNERRVNEAEFEQGVKDAVLAEQKIEAPQDENADENLDSEDAPEETLPEEIKTDEDLAEEAVEAAKLAAANGDMSAALGGE